MNPKEHVQTISRDYQANSRTQEALQGAMRHVKRSFSKRGHLLMEFIQNAEDVSATKMLVKLEESKITICNNGKPFTAPNVDSICSIGKSTKTAADYIGYLGVGFKSAFLLADSVSIHSGDYDFAFDFSKWPEGAPWQIMPVWLDDQRETDKSWPTVFHLSHLNSAALVALKDSFSSFQPRTLLWLDHLTSLIIVDDETIKCYEKSPVAPGVWRITVTNGNNNPVIEDWLIVHDDRPVPDNVRIDQTTKDWDREDVKVRRVAAAFHLDQDRGLLPVPEGTVYITIYSYTPLKEEAVAIHFLMQADFITAPNRESVHRDAEWNKWLAHELLKMVRDKCIPIFLSEQKWRGKFQNVLRVADDGNHPIWDELIRRPLAQHLNSAAIFPTWEGSLTSLSNVIKVPENMKELIGQQEIDLLYPGKKMVANNVDFEVPITVNDSLMLIMHENAGILLKHMADRHDLLWFAKLYLGLKSYLPLSHYRKGQLRGAGMFLLRDDFGLAPLDSTFTNLNGTVVPTQVTSDFNVLHPGLLLSSAGLLEIMSGIGVGPLSDELIKKAVVHHQLPDISGRWGSLSESDKTSWVRLFKEYSVEDKDLEFITLPTIENGWKSPRTMIFSPEYGPEPNILRLDDVTEFCLDPIFLNGSRKPDEVASWLCFFKSLGVGAPLTIQRMTQLAQRVGTKVAIAYERAAGSEAEELPESVSHEKGYDVTSELGTNTKMIEAKGRTSNEEITITHNQWKALLLNPDDYFVYVVLDALSSDPLLYPISGKNLQTIDFSLRVQPATWKKASASPIRYSTFIIKQQKDDSDEPR